MDRSHHETPPHEACPAEAAGRKRVCRACDRCRLKKSKCDGRCPCGRCALDDSICVFGKRKRSHDKVYPKGYVEMLEQQQVQLVVGLRELYQRTKNGAAWNGPPLADTENGHPLTHDILEGLGILDLARLGDFADLANDLGPVEYSAPSHSTQALADHHQAAKPDERLARRHTNLMQESTPKADVLMAVDDDVLGSRPRTADSLSSSTEPASYSALTSRRIPTTVGPTEVDRKQLWQLYNVTDMTDLGLGLGNGHAYHYDRSWNNSSADLPMFPAVGAGSGQTYLPQWTEESVGRNLYQQQLT
ncbi:MAG: hypothetical protein M1817_004270 [Caeruleum heppii]|nr:MAG: hypothetical protein M1817_004270 [Caeruleum heppii]